MARVFFFGGGWKLGTFLALALVKQGLLLNAERCTTARDYNTYNARTNLSGHLPHLQHQMVAPPPKCNHNAMLSHERKKEKKSDTRGVLQTTIAKNAPECSIAHKSNSNIC